MQYNKKQVLIDLTEYEAMQKRIKYLERFEPKKQKKTIDERKTEFSTSLSAHLTEYGKDMLNEFYSYWTEHGEKDKKMRFEKQTSFDIVRRLSTWKRNNKNNGTKRDTKTGATTTTSERQDFS
jgi:hypothetical protein